MLPLAEEGGGRKVLGEAGRLVSFLTVMAPDTKARFRSLLRSLTTEVGYSEPELQDRNKCNYFF